MGIAGEFCAWRAALGRYFGNGGRAEFGPKIAKVILWRREKGRRLEANLVLGLIVNCIYSSSPYRAVNTLRLSYKNPSVNAV